MSDAGLRQRFENAQARVRSLTRTPSAQELLELYGLYKQGSLGDVQGQRPSVLDVKGRTKYDAWAARKGLPPAAAMQAYVDLVERLVNS